MEPITLFYPMLALVSFTFLVGFRLVALRFGAVKSGAVKMSFFRACLGTQPEELAVAQRAYANLFETPPLFYVICALMIALRQASAIYAVTNVIRCQGLFTFHCDRPHTQAAPHPITCG